MRCPRGRREADIAIATDAAALPGIVGITPTAGLFSADESRTRITILAPTLTLADAATAILANGAPSRPWPADTRLAAPPTPVGNPGRPVFWTSHGTRRSPQPSTTSSAAVRQSNRSIAL